MAHDESLKPKKRTPGTPEHVWDETIAARIVECCSSGWTRKDIANEVGISIPTILKHYRAELDEADAVANDTIKNTLFKVATEDRSVPALIFWCKVRMGWVEKAKLEVSTPGAEMDLSKLSTDELIQLEKLHAKASIAPASPSGD
jgi:hypothetical protein